MVTAIDMKLVNLGCGRRVHPQWVNFDFVASVPGVQQADLRKGIPLPDQSADAIYHAHVLEHFGRPDGERLLKECCRVLKPGGVIRVVVPDLEQIARDYLESLNAVRVEGSGEARRRHAWMVAELVDQCARHQPSGECLEMIRSWPLSERSFLIQRWGREAQALLDQVGSQSAVRSSPWHRRLLRRCWNLWRRFAARVDADALAVGRFRLGGEPHLWMYDEWLLAECLNQAGFVSAMRLDASSSQIAEWPLYGLDAGPDGLAYKPDSLYMEAVKPLD